MSEKQKPIECLHDNWIIKGSELEGLCTCEDCGDQMFLSHAFNRLRERMLESMQIKTIKAGPGDVIVINYEEKVDLDDAKSHYKLTQDAFPDNKVLLTSIGVELKVIKQSKE